jgi:hypothetical protein
MATYIRGLSDIMPIPAPFQPDFGMIQKTLGTMQNKYDQGFAAISNQYNQLAGKAITNPTLIKRRDQYIRSAQDQLKNLATVDLSSEDNVKKAESVFEPFWKDDAMLFDMNVTQRNQEAYQQAQDYANSDDPKRRAMYNPLAEEYIQNGVDELRNASVEDGSIFRVKPRKFVPFANIQEDLTKKAKDLGYKIEYTQQNGAYKVKITNGPSSFDSWYTFGKAMMGNDYDEQMNVVSTVEYERNKKNYQILNPGMSEQDLKKQYAIDRVGSFRKSAETNLKAYQGNLEKVNSEILDLKEQVKGIKLTPNHPAVAKLQKLLQNKQILESQYIPQAQQNVAQYSKGTDPNNYNQLIESIASDPVGYTKAYIHDTEARNFATISANNSQEDYQLDPAWKENMDHQEWMKKYELDLRDQNRKDAESQFKMDHPGAGGKLGSLSGHAGAADGSKMTAGEKKEMTLNQGEYLGLDAMNPDKVDVYKEYSDFTTGMENQMNSLLLDYRYAGKALKYLPGLSESEAVRSTGVLQKWIANPGGLNSDEKQLMSKLAQKLNVATGGTGEGNSGPQQTKQMFLAYMNKRYAEKRKDEDVPPTEDDGLIAGYYADALKLQEQHNSYIKALKDREQVLLQSPEFAGLKNSKGELVSSDDFASKLGTALVETEDGKIDFLDSKKLADLYAHGKIKQSGNPMTGGTAAIEGYKNFVYTPKSGDGNISEAFGELARSIQNPLAAIGGIGSEIRKRLSSTLTDITGVGEYGNGDALLHHDLNTINQTVGVKTAEEFGKKLESYKRKAMMSIAPENLKNGIQGHRFRYYLDDNTFGETGEKIINEALNPANIQDVMLDHKPADTSDREKILTLMGENAGSLKESIGGAVDVVMRGNKAIVEIKIPSTLKDDSPIVKAGLKKGSTIGIELSQNASGDGLKDLVQSTNLYVWGDLLKGKVMKSDAILENSGFRYTLTPNNDYVHANIQKKVYNQETNKWDWEDVNIGNEIIPLTGENRKNPDEIRYFILNQLYPYYLKEQQAQLQLNRKNSQQSGGLSLDEFEKQFKQQLQFK